MSTAEGNGLPTFGVHEVQKRLGVGGMSEVYLALNSKLGRLEAVKILQSRDSRDPRAQARLLREAQALARLSHPNIVNAYGCDIAEDGTVYLVMEFLAGPTLAVWQSEPNRSWRELLAVYVAAGRGLAAAHRVGLVHGDFTPGNVLLAEGPEPADRRAKVIDFGLAVTDQDEHSADPHAPGVVSRTSARRGTPYYASPEQLDGSRAKTSRSDQFSFCVALYEALYRQHPFYRSKPLAVNAQMATESAGSRGTEAETGDPPTNEVLRAIRDEPLCVPRSQGDRPRQLFRILSRGLAHDPDARYASMYELLHKLEGLLLPRRVWQYALFVSLGLVALAFGLYLTLAWNSASAVACGQYVATLETVWNEQRAREITEAFAATTDPYAPAAAAALVRGFSAYADEWSDITGTTCGAAPGIAGGERLQCLGSRLDRFAEAIDAVLRDPQQSARRIDVVLAELPPIADCTGSRVPLCGDTSSYAAVDGFVGALKQARADRVTGDYDAAVKHAARAQDLAATQPELLAEAALVHGTILSELADYGRASAALRTAYIAAERAGCEGMAIDAANRLTKNSALDPAPPGFGTDWWFIAQAKLESGYAGASEDAHARMLFDLRTAEILNNRGLLRQRKLKDPACVKPGQLGCKNDLVGAERDFKDALTLRQSIHPRPLAEIAVSLRNLGAVRFLRGGPDEGIALLREALELDNAAFGVGHPATWKSHFDLGKALVDSGQPEEAASQLEQALRLVVLASGPDNPKVGEVHLELAKRHEDAHPADALAHTQAAIAIYTRCGLPDSYPRLFHVLREHGYVLQQMGRYEEALKIRRRILDATPRNDLEELMYSNVELAETLIRTKSWSEALAHAKMALTLADLLAVPAGDPEREDAESLRDKAQRQDSPGP